VSADHRAAAIGAGFTACSWPAPIIGTCNTESAKRRERKGMRSFGFKFVERLPAEIEPLVGRALRERLPVEVGLYFGEPRALELLVERLPGSGLPVAVHLDHRRLSIVDLETREAQLRGQLALAARLGAAYVITHLSPYPMTPRTERQGEMLDRLYAGVRFAAAVCAEHSLGLHIENTYHDLTFYRRFFAGVLAAGIEGVGVCFDLGHAKVWSTEGLGDWLGFLSELADHGRRLHFHLHANRGLSDEHLSFVTAERLGITGADGFTGNIDYYEALGEIAKRFPTASKVFEVPAGEAEANLDLVRERLAAIGVLKDGVAA
jgi:sugar phosphate isomerase/epimerase